MRLYSFRTRIILTIIIIIISVSSISFYTYYYYLSQRIYKNAEENIITLMDFLKDQLFYSIHLNNGTIIKSFLANLEENDMVMNAWLLNPDGTIMYPSGKNYDIKGTLNPKELEFSDKNRVITTNNSDPNPYSRVFMRLQNSPSCYNCHSSSQKTLGYIVIDYSIKGTKNNIVFARKLSIIFTVIMVAIILLVAIFMHYKFVRKSIQNFYTSISEINKGNLDERLAIPITKELGQLGESFNKMLDNFQKAQKELQQYHQRELSSAQRLATIGEMAARLAHEIRNPMTGISNAMEIIIKEMKDEQNKPILEEIKRQANRVNIAVSDLLKFSRSREIVLSKGNINDIIESVVFFLQNQNSDKRITFITKLQSDIPFFDFDIEQIENVISNLGLNAMQSIDERGAITFKSSYNGSEKLINIAVEDNGNGIPHDVLKNIFSPFFTTKTEGTGLGLAIAKEIIEKHDGQIWAVNNTEKGCTFNISLPAIS
jgi:two-component system, NtrC family, sensor kinase